MNPHDPTTGAVVAPAPRRLFRLPEALQAREFRRFWVGETVSLFGDQVTLIALPLVGVLALNASAAQMGYLGAALLFPNLLFSLHAGAWVDRRGRRREMMIFSGARPRGRCWRRSRSPTRFGVLTLTQLYMVGFLIGTLSVLFYVSYTTLFVLLVPRERYLEASSLLNGSRAFSYVAGPSLGGLLVQAFSAPVALVVDAFSFVVSALTMHSIHPQEPPTEPAGRGHVKAGMRYIWRLADRPREAALDRDDQLLQLRLLGALHPLRHARAGVRPGVLGLVLGAGAVGGVLGSLVTGRLSRRYGVGPVLVMGSCSSRRRSCSCRSRAAATGRSTRCLFLAEFISGFGVMMLDITAGCDHGRARARPAARPRLGRLHGRQLRRAAGRCARRRRARDWIGLRPTLWIASVGAIAGVLWLLPSPIPHLRELPEADQ